VACTAGSFSAGSGASACAACAAGSFSTGSGASACAACAAGQATDGSAPCADCGIGTYAGEAACLPCAAGSFKPAGASDCDPCQPGTYSTAVGAGAGATCEACAAGTYSTAEGLPAPDLCLPCEAGVSSEAGSTICLACPPGMFATSSSCVDCPAYSSSQGGGVVNSCECDAGFYQYYRVRASGGAETYVPNTNTNQLFRLHSFYPAGTLEVLRDTQMILMCDGMVVYSDRVIQAGTHAVPDDFLLQTGVPTCQYATTVYYAVSGDFDPTESTAYFKCVPCPAGYASGAAGSDACTICGSGRYSPGDSECRPCPPGSVSSPGAASCIVCPSGWYQSSAETCMPCATGTASGPPPSTACTACPLNYWAATGSMTCTACPVLSTSLGATGPAGCWCQAGTYLNLAMAPLACLMCPAGQYAPFASTACGQCPPGTHTPLPGGEACRACPAGTFAPDAGSSACRACAPGQISDQDHRSCSSCPFGYYCVPGLPAQQCPIGSLVNGTGLARAEDCPRCPADFICPDIVTAKACPLNTAAPPGSTIMSMCTCKEGFSCTYVPTKTAVVQLPMSIAEFEKVRADFIKAVAEAAGVSPEQIIIINIREIPLVRRSMDGSRIHVSVTLFNTTALRGLDVSLRRHGLPRAIRPPRLERAETLVARPLS